jgi:hypothetical protein
MHAQALLTRLARAVSCLEKEDQLHARYFAGATELLQAAGRAMNRDGPAAPAPSSEPSRPGADQQREETGHDSDPDLETWLASNADMLTSDTDHGTLPMSESRWVEEFTGRTAGQPIAFLRVDDAGPHMVIDTVSRGSELRSHIAQALYLITGEAPRWSPQTRALATDLLRRAEIRLTQRYATVTGPGLEIR